jgi:hypothetical protein
VEDPPAAGRKRPPRRYYELTDFGRDRLGGLVRAATAEGRVGVRRDRRGSRDERDAERVTLWPALLIALTVWGFAPDLVLRLLSLAFWSDDPRRTEMRAELDAVPRWERPFWVLQHRGDDLLAGTRQVRRIASFVVAAADRRPP